MPLRPRTDNTQANKVKSRRSDEDMYYLYYKDNSGYFKPLPLPVDLVANKRLGMDMEITRLRQFSLVLKAYMTSVAIMVMVSQFFFQLEKWNIISYPEFLTPFLFVLASALLVYSAIQILRINIKKTATLYCVVVSLCLALNVEMMLIMHLTSQDVQLPVANSTNFVEIDEQGEMKFELFETPKCAFFGNGNGTM